MSTVSDIRNAAMKAKDGVIRIKDSVVNGVGKRIDTVSGKAVIEQVIKFAQETDAVNTAIVTRIYEILGRQAKLEERQRRARNFLNISLVLNVLCIFAIVYILARGR